MSSSLVLAAVTAIVCLQVPSVPLPFPEHVERPRPLESYVIETRAQDMPRVEAAARSWARTVPVHFDYKTGDCAGLIRRRICVHWQTTKQFSDTASEHSWPDSWVGSTTPSVNNDCAEVWVDGGNESADQIMLHELGHAIGLEHDFVLPSAMWPSVSPAASAITCRDIAQWFHVHGRLPPSWCQKELVRPGAWTHFPGMPTVRWAP